MDAYLPVSIIGRRPILLLDVRNDQHKPLVSAYKDKMKIVSQRLLLSGQNVSIKQGQIERLR